MLWGPLTGSNVSRYCNNHSYNKNATRTAMIKAAANQSPPVFGFDCVCLIKGILWGWDGDASRTYGGAGYAINGVPDIGADTMITKCTGVSTTGWDDMVIGEAVWMSGHIGIYIGDGLAVECSPKWENKVQITAVGNIGSKAGYNTRRWTKHGKLPYVDYTGASTGGGSQGTTQPSKPSEGTVGACVGDTVTFTGNKHYVSSNALNGSACKPGKAKVTAMAGNAKHPYHLIKVAGGGSTVYGWVAPLTSRWRAASPWAPRSRSTRGPRPTPAAAWPLSSTPTLTPSSRWTVTGWSSARMAW